MRKIKLFFLASFLVASFVPSPSTAQSVWDKIKQQAKQAQQQKQQQPGQPPQQQGQKPGQQKTQGAAQSNAPANDSGPVTPPPGTKIDPVVLAPFEQGGQFAVSPHGVHVAALSHSGSRQVIIYDGVPGPKFDQFTPQGGGGPVPVIFSSDGNHYAYCGLSSDHFTVMVDGKEVGHGSETNTGALNCTIFFSPNGKHFYYSTIQHSGDYRQGLAYSRLVVDGKTEIKVFEGVPSDLRNIIFSPDGDHFAAVFPSPTDPERSALFVDGKPVAVPGGEPQWSADSKHLFTRRNVPLPGTRQGSTWEVLLDGKPIMRADAVTLYVPPAGNMVVAMVQKLSVNPPISFLVVGGRQVPGSEVQSGNISNITFSPDGKHYAALYKNANSRSWIFADGKKGQEYGGIMLHNEPGRLPSNLLFTADSSRVVYESSTGSPYGEYLVLGDQESDELMSLTDTVIAPVGGHVATEGYGQVSLDGKILKLPNVDPHTSQATALSFSPDASHVAFVLHTRGGVTLYLDGQPQSAYSPALQGPLTNAGTRPYIFSPDSKHIAYFCWQSGTAAGTEQGLCVDNKYVRIGAPAYYANLTFTSDSNHLMWSKNLPQAEARIFVDGKPVLDGFPTSTGGFTKETWQIGTDGNLLVLLQSESDSSLNRVNITPSPDLNISTLMGNPPGRNKP
jgi:WD40 repeat protein